MKVLTKWLRSYLPEIAISDIQLAEDLTLRGIAVEGIYSLGKCGSLYESECLSHNRANLLTCYRAKRG